VPLELPARRHNKLCAMVESAQAASQPKTKTPKLRSACNQCNCSKVCTCVSGSPSSLSSLAMWPARC
jgi:hypothetical protein